MSNLVHILLSSLLFLFNATATTEIYTLSLHDALPISDLRSRGFTNPNTIKVNGDFNPGFGGPLKKDRLWFYGSARDRKSTRLNSSHTVISYAVFCLKKKNHNCCTYEGKCDLKCIHANC